MVMRHQMITYPIISCLTVNQSAFVWTSIMASNYCIFYIVTILNVSITFRFLKNYTVTKLHHIRYMKYTVSGKKRTNSILGITLSNTGRFSKFFQCRSLLEICNKTVIKFPTTPQTRRYTTL